MPHAKHFIPDKEIFTFSAGPNQYQSPREDPNRSAALLPLTSSEGFPAERHAGAGPSGGAEGERTRLGEGRPAGAAVMDP